MENEKIAAFQKAKHQTMKQFEEEENSKDNKSKSKSSSNNKEKQTQQQQQQQQQQSKSKLLISTPSANPFLSEQMNNSNNSNNENLDFETLMDANEQRDVDDEFEEIEVNEQSDQKKNTLFGQKSYKTQNDDEIVTTIVQDINFDKNNENDEEENEDSDDGNEKSNRNQTQKQRKQQQQQQNQQTIPKDNSLTSTSAAKYKVSKPFQQRQNSFQNANKKGTLKSNIAKRKPVFSQSDKKKHAANSSFSSNFSNKKTAAFRK